MNGYFVAAAVLIMVTIFKATITWAKEANRTLNSDYTNYYGRDYTEYNE